MSLILFGHQYCGKSYLGRYLSSKFKRPWIDTDEKITVTYKQKFFENLSCREIFLKHGESFFRDLETEVICNLNLFDEAVISIGGGSLCCDASKRHLQKSFLLWVVCSKKTLKQRTLSNLPPYYDLSCFDSSFEKRFQQRELLFRSLNTSKIFVGV